MPCFLKPPRAIGALALLLLAGACAAGPAAPPPASSPAGPPSAAVPASADAAELDPVVAEPLRRMSALLAAAPTLGLRVTVTREGVLPNGQMVLLRSTAELAMRRPNRLVVLAGSDAGNFRLSYDGEQVALLDLDGNTHGRSAFTGSVDALLDALERRFRLDIPVRDLLAPDPFAALVGPGTTGVLVGQTVIDDVVCDHYALRTGEVDWEIWIEADGRGLPRQISSVDRGVPERPRVIALLQDWSLAPRLPANAFSTSPPPGARQLTVSDTRPQGSQP